MSELLLTRPRVHEELAVERISGRLLAAGRTDLLHIFEDEAGERSEVGERIVELSDGIRTVGAIIDVLCDEFEVDHATCKADTLAFVEKLVALEILQLD